MALKLTWFAGLLIFHSEKIRTNAEDKQGIKEVEFKYYNDYDVVLSLSPKIKTKIESMNVNVFGLEGKYFKNLIKNNHKNKATK